MKTMIENTLAVLKEKIKNNLLQIQNNQIEIKNLLHQPVSAERDAELEEKHALNKILLTENSDFINVQLTLTNFLEKYQDSDVLDDKELVSAPVRFKDEDECFEHTVSNRIPYDEKHPFYNNESFFQKLLKHYQNAEDYEMCDKLVKSKQQKIKQQ